MLTKAEALLKAVRDTNVHHDIILHNADGSIWCILMVVAKEHSEDECDGGSIINPSEDN